jgi:hypothetical protein
MRRGAIAVVAGGLLVLAGCSFNIDSDMKTGPLEEMPVSIEAGTADRANVELNMRAGEMDVSGGGTKLLEGNIEYNVATWKPQISSTKNGVHASVTVRQPENGSANMGNHVKNTWDLRLSNKNLLDLAINFGAGKAKLDLGDVLLRSLQVQIGVGEVDLDLEGKPTRDYDVTIHGGIGKASVRLPKGVGVYANARGGIGSINVTGLHKEGDHWENDLYDKAKVNVKVEVEGGIGEIRLIG